MFGLKNPIEKMATKIQNEISENKRNIENFRYYNNILYRCYKHLNSRENADKKLYFMYIKIDGTEYSIPVNHEWLCDTLGYSEGICKIQIMGYEHKNDKLEQELKKHIVYG